VDAFIKELGIPDMTSSAGSKIKKHYRLNINNSASARSSTHHDAKVDRGRQGRFKEACDEMIQVMLGQEFNESIPALVTSDVKVAHKTGWTGDFFHDIGIIFPPQRKPYIHLAVHTRISS
jgi:beta-lactamase class A